jgi:fructose-1,6-bisphosphatase/inositol monophosphatase family enzyme
MLPDSDRVARLIAEAAAAEIMPRFEKLGAGDVSEKGPGDLVTVADTESERVLTAALGALLPGSLVVGEEAVAADRGVLAALAGEDPVWLIDPVDGTANFAAGIPMFAVIVALVRRGETVMGWIHDPVRRATAHAERGAGAWCEGKRLKVAPSSPPGAMSGALNPRLGNRRLARKIAGRSNLIGSSFNFRCAGQEYMALAGGKAHFALYQRLHPWDHAAGQLLHAEAGGYSALLDGSPYSPRKGEGGLLLTPDRTSWRALHEILIGETESRLA